MFKSLTKKFTYYPGTYADFITFSQNGRETFKNLLPLEPKLFVYQYKTVGMISLFEMDLLNNADECYNKLKVNFEKYTYILIQRYIEIRI